MLLRSVTSRNIPKVLFYKGSRLLSTESEIFSKYKAKLEEKAKSHGVESIDHLKVKLKDELAAHKREFSKVDPLEQLEEYRKRQEQELENERNANTIKIRSPVSKDSSKLPYKTLNSFVDVEKLQELEKADIETIWKARFQSSKGSIFAILNGLQFASMYANAFKNPSFILPLPKGDGYEIHFIQWSFVGPSTTHCMLTTLAEYKLHNEYAKPHTTLMFHQELSQSKDLVLMNGYIDDESSLKIDEVELLVLNIQRFYGAMQEKNSKTKQELLSDFTSGNPEFSMDDLVKTSTTFE